MKKNEIKKLTGTAICIAFGLLLPQIFHIFGAGTVFLPMHIPVLICGFVCGAPYGLLCGVITPLLSSLATGMPPIFPMGIAMMFELAVYGFLTGYLYKKTNVYVALLGAMLGGRLVSGVAKAILFGVANKPFGLQLFLTDAFVTALPGIIIQIVVIPVLVLALKRAKLIVQDG